VTFAPDQHRSAFPRAWLEDHALGDGADGDGRTEDDKQLWLPADLGPETGLPAMSWPSYLADQLRPPVRRASGTGPRQPS